MAKRRRLEAPDTSELEALEAGFAAKPVLDRLGVVAPIAHVAGEAAAGAEHGDRVAAAEAESWRRAVEEGRVVERLPTGQVIVEHLVRDRLSSTQEDLDELKLSIRMNGVRTPIEVTRIEGGWGLISGWRRLTALLALQAEGLEGFDTVPAIIRSPRDAGAAYAAMVEENEVRAQLTPYERGRIAVVAAGQGAFRDIEGAVAGLYASASKAKRSKIRSFVVVHEELGDLLTFPTELSEKMGLRLAAAIKDGFGDALRAALATGQGTDPATEVALLERVLARHEAETCPDLSRGGRPRKAGGPRRSEGRTRLTNGISMERVAEDDGFSIRLRGRAVDAELVDTVMLEIRRLLEPS